MRNADGFTLQVKVEDQRSQEAAEIALERLRTDLLGPGGNDETDYEPGMEPRTANYVSEVIRLPGGPFLYADAHMIPKKELGKLPGALYCTLERLAVGQATILVPGFDERNPAARAPVVRDALALVAFLPSFDDPFPAAWIELSEEWVLRGPSQPSVGVIVGNVTLTVEAEQVGSLLRKLGSSAGIRIARLVGPTVRVVDLHDVGVPRLVLAVGANPTGDDGPNMDAEMVALLTILERLASQDAFGFITVEENLRSLHLDVHTPANVEGAPMPRNPGVVLTQLDSMLFDAFPAQILGPRHRVRLPDLDPNWVRPASPSRELLLFPPSPHAWLPRSSEYPATARRYRQLLAPCLSHPDEPDPD